MDVDLQVMDHDNGEHDGRAEPACPLCAGAVRYRDSYTWRGFRTADDRSVDIVVSLHDRDGRTHYTVTVDDQAAGKGMI